MSDEPTGGPLLGLLARAGSRLSKVLPTGNGATPPYQTKAIGSGVTFVGSPDWRQVMRIGIEPDPEAEELTREIALATSAYAYTAIMWRASKLSEPPLGVTELDPEGEETSVDGHDLDMLLQEPSPDFDMGELQQLTEIYRLVTGSALWVRVEDLAGRPAGFIPFSGDEFDTFAAEGRIYGRFEVRTKSGPRTFLPDEVVHFRDVNPNSWRRGLSRLDVALSQLDLGHQVNRTVRSFMRKAMFPGGVISPDPDWNPDEGEWERFENRILAWHQGPENAGEPLVVEGGTTFSRTAIALKELIPGDLLNRIEAVVGAVFGTPPVVLGWQVGLENSPWSNMEQARRMIYEDTIEPRWRDVEKRMARQMLPREEREAGRKIRFDTTDVRAFAEDDKVRAETAGSMRKEWTRNERRVYTGMDPLPPDDPRGDEIETGAGGLLGGLGDGDDGDLSASMALILQAKGVVDEKSLQWAIFDVSTKAAESTWAREVGKALREARDAVLGIAESVLERKQEEAEPDAVIEFIGAVGEWVRKEGSPLFRRTTLPLVISTGTTAVRRLGNAVNLSFAVLEEGLLEFAAEEADFLADVMGETTGRMVAETVQDQLAEGGLITDIRKALRDDHAFSTTRAQLVARTETTRAWNGAQRRSMSTWERNQDETERAFKTWLSSRDARVRPEHQELDGTRLRIDQLFDNGLQNPGEPNCRCTLLYEIEEVGEPEPTESGVGGGRGAPQAGATAG